MSTEIVPTPDAAAKKDKKRKKNRDEAEEKKHGKKRKREREDEEERGITAEALAEEVDTSASAKKKDKKPKKRKHDEEAPAVEVPTSPIEITPSPKHKKSKSKPTADSTQHLDDSRLATHSPFIHQTTSLYVSLSPCASAFPLEGLCAEHLSPLLLTYYPPLRAVVLAYSDARIDEEPPDLRRTKTSSSSMALAKHTTDSAPPFIWLTATFLLFRPTRGTFLEGYVSLQNESLLALVCYNYFNAVVPSEKLPLGWRWVHGTNGEEPGGEMVDGKWMVRGSGWWVDARGQRVEGRLVLRVEDFEAGLGSAGDVTGGSVSITGSMREETEVVVEDEVL